MNSKHSIQRMCHILNNFNFPKLNVSQIPTFVLKHDVDRHNKEVLLKTLPFINSLYEKLRSAPLDEENIRERYNKRKEQYEYLMNELNKPEKIELCRRIKEVENEISLNKGKIESDKIFVRKDLSIKLFNILLANESSVGFNDGDYSSFYDDIVDFDVNGVSDDEISFLKKIEDFLK
ncbi:hypothetical protein DMUE_0964 [Dictyocoela muelleri]|nr:hypothetical protein DMUE_0964 [Dictyocoela muelleri]